MDRFVPGFLVVLLLLGFSGCRSPEQPAEPPTADTSAVASPAFLPPDSARAPSGTPADTLTSAGTPVSPPDTLAPVATVAVPLTLLDSLRREVAALRQEIIARNQQADTAAVQAAPDTLSLGTGLRTTAEGLEYVGLRTLLALLVIVIVFFLIRGLTWLFDTLAEQSATRRLLFKKLIPITRLLIWSIASYYIITGVFAVRESQLLAASAAVGVAIGFAAQDVLKNIFGGLIIILDQPFQVGDKISVGGTYGEVVSIGLRSTRIVTLDDNLVSVPNAQVVEGQVANANAGALDCQVVTDLYLPGWIDVTRAKHIAYHAAATSRYVYLNKPIVVLVKDEFKETFLTHLVVKAYVLDTRYESVFSSEITETAKAAFLAEGMLAPFHRPLPEIARPDPSSHDGAEPS